MKASYFPIIIYSLMAIGLGGMLLFVSHILGPKRPLKHKFDPYECGVDLQHSNEKRFHVQFYLIATFFILFDVETVFLIPWAVYFQEMSRLAIIEMLVFLVILAFGLIYILKKQVFEWRSGRTGKSIIS